MPLLHVVAGVGSVVVGAGVEAGFEIGVEVEVVDDFGVVVGVAVVEVEVWVGVVVEFCCVCAW